jgi:hypothetical protein
VFNMMPTGGEGYWNSMLGGHATSRYGEEAFEHFEQRYHGHMNINIITLLLSRLQYLEGSPVYGTSNEEKTLRGFCRQKVAIIGHFRLSFLKEADFAHKGSSFKD